MQSFAAGEVTPELAHQIAKELADRVLGGQYEYVISTHLNTGHIHSHIVWNSVSCVDGKKYRSNYKSYVTEIRAVSDELCRKYKLSVIDTENSNHVAKPYAEWLAEKNNQPTWRTAIRQDVDDAIRQSLTWRQFVAALQNKGYELQFNRKYPVLRPPGKERFVRFKTLGKRYTAEVIQNRLLYPQFDRCFVENSPRVQYGRLHSGKKSRRKLTGLRALYYRYLYELGALPRKPSRSIITQSGSSGMSSVSLPQELIDAINNVGFWDSIPLWAVTLIGGLLITVLSFTMILTVYGRMFSLWMYAAIAPIPLSTFAGEPTSSVGKNFIRSYAGVCLQGVVIALSCIIFSAISSSPPAVDTGASVVTAVWTYVGELAFNLLVLVGAIKGCDRIVKEIMGL